MVLVSMSTVNVETETLELLNRVRGYRHYRDGERLRNPDLVRTIFQEELDRIEKEIAQKKEGFS